MNTCDSCTSEGETGGSQVQSQAVLHSEHWTSQGFIARAWLKIQNEQTKSMTHLMIWS